MERDVERDVTDSGVEGGEALPRRRVLEIAIAGAAALLAACGGDANAGNDAPAGSTGKGAGAGASGGGGDGSGGAGVGGSAEGGGGAGSGGAGGGGQCAEFGPVCDETEDNPLGPYYRANAPFTSKLDNPLGTGELLLIEGRVMASDCATPLADAVVEVWQADANGDYDNETGDPGPSVWVLRGRIKTDACGRYAFDSIIPGRYLNGPQYRPAHIHYRVTHPAAKELVTQLYFEGDPYNAVDGMYEKALEIGLTTERGPNGAFKRGVFDIVLPPA